MWTHPAQCQSPGTSSCGSFVDHPSKAPPLRRGAVNKLAVAVVPVVPSPDEVAGKSKALPFLAPQPKVFAGPPKQEGWGRFQVVVEQQRVQQQKQQRITTKLVGACER